MILIILDGKKTSFLLKMIFLNPVFVSDNGKTFLLLSNSFSGSKFLIPPHVDVCVVKIWHDRLSLPDSSSFVKRMLISHNIIKCNLRMHFL